MQLIKLGSKFSTMVDDEDYLKYGHIIWIAHNTGCRIYASRLDNGRRIYLHKLICPSPKNMHTDHISGDTLDNRKVNLRAVTYSLNQHNKGKLKTNTSGYKGVSKRNRCNPWMAKIDINGQQIYLGQFATREEAARAYDKASFAQNGFTLALNFPEDYIK